MNSNDSGKTEPWILMVEYRDGVNTSAYLNREDAKRALLAYVTSWWSLEVGDKPMPEDGDEAIEVYFGLADGESFTIAPAIFQD